jgi:hypothetical protein
MKNAIWHETQARLNEKMLTLREMTGLSHLTCKLKTSFNFFWTKRDKTRAMINEAIVNSFMSPF